MMPGDPSQLGLVSGPRAEFPYWTTKNSSKYTLVSGPFQLADSNPNRVAIIISMYASVIWKIGVNSNVQNVWSFIMDANYGHKDLKLSYSEYGGLVQGEFWAYGSSGSGYNLCVTEVIWLPKGAS